MERLRSVLETHEKNARRETLDGFMGAFQSAEIVPRLRAENPPEYRVSPFTIAFDFTSESAEIRYSRLPFAKTSNLDGGSLLTVWRNAKELLDKSSTDLDRLTGALTSAYRALLARKGGCPGDRVELHELYPEIAFTLQPQKFYDEVDRRNLVSYSRVQFVHDLTRLRSERKLAVGEYRADIGVAHADSASSRRRAFWLEDETGQGTYCTTFRLVQRVSSAEPPPANTDPRLAV